MPELVRRARVAATRRTGTAAEGRARLSAQRGPLAECRWSIPRPNGVWIRSPTQCRANVEW